MKTSPQLLPVSAEFKGASLGDARLVARLCQIADTLAADPEASLPEAHKDASQLEASYRFFGNPNVSAQAVLESHIHQTLVRVNEHDTVLVIHDTTSFTFGGKREGLGRVGSNGGEGFLAHYSLCVGLNGCPLGTLGLYAWHRTKPIWGKRPQQESQYDPDKESQRWNDAVHETDDLLQGSTSAIHVMDREGDCMELLADMCEHGRRFVVRAAHDRRLSKERRKRGVPKLYETLAATPIVLERDVCIVQRAKKVQENPKEKSEEKTTKHKPSYGTSWLGYRKARLEVRAQTLNISPGNGAHAHIPDVLTLNFIDVTEASPPEGMEPIHWRLITKEPIEEPEQVKRCIDIYRQRWLIEEFNKALKTGCRYEELQLESGERLVRALSVYTAIAWRMLFIRWMDRNAPELPASKVLTSNELEVLTAYCANTRRPLPVNPTIRDVTKEIARMGGHLSQNGPPGWQIIGKGLEKLQLLASGWAMKAQFDST